MHLSSNMSVGSTSWPAIAQLTSSRAGAGVCTPFVHGAVGRLRFWRPFPRQVMEVTCGDGAPDALPLHAHEALTVFLPVSRFVVTNARGVSTVLRPGLVHVVAPLELQAVRSIDGAPCAMMILLVSPDVVSMLPVQQTRPSTVTEGLRARVVDDAGLYTRLRALVEESRGPLVALDCAERLRECLRQLLTASAEPGCSLASPGGRQRAGVARVREYLREHVADNVSLEDLAALAALSKFYLLRAFTRAHGVTPHAYQMLLRLARAWRLIGEGVSLGRATYDAGFADQSHLTRRFSEAYGITPGRYAKLLAVPPGSTAGTAFESERAAVPHSAA